MNCWLYWIPGITDLKSIWGYRAASLGPLETTFSPHDYSGGGPRYAHLLALFWLCPQLSIPKNVQHQLNMDWVGQRYRSSECQLGCTCCLGQWFSNCVLKNSRCCKEVSLGVTMVVKEDACGSFQGPHSCFIYSSFSFTLGFHIVFIQRASWSQSLWKTNDLRISCSQNAEIQKIGHRNQKLWAKPVVSQEGVFLVILP